MKEECPVCGHRFGREHGYFQGAMYVSYALSLGSFGLLSVVALILVPSHSPQVALAFSLPIFLPLVPVMFRYSRVIWMHLFYHAF